MIKPENKQEALKIVWDLLIEGDTRYNESVSEKLVAELLLNNAVSIEEREIPNVPVPSEQDLWKFKGSPQQEYKYLGEILLKKEGFQDSEIFPEIYYLFSRPDIFALSKGKTILIECCSCRVSKVVEYLSEENSELWLLTMGSMPWDSGPVYREKSRWFILKRGENWSKFREKLKQEYLCEFKKLPDLIAGLNKNDKI